MELIRALWENETVDFEGRWHRASQAGVNLQPPSKIPIWFGGIAGPLLAHAASMGDGWFPLIPPDDRGKAAVAKVLHHLDEAG